jgi:hypothetical protein
MKTRYIGLTLVIFLILACALTTSQSIEPPSVDTVVPLETTVLSSATPEQPFAPPTSPPVVDGVNLVQPADLEYLGAFRLPEGGERPYTFAYGGNAMTFNPDGDPGGGADGFPGSLFISGHDRLPYGELPNGDQVAEVNIPVPVQSKDLSMLNRADFIQNFQDVTRGFFTDLEEIPTVGMLYLNKPETGPKIHLAWGQHIQYETVPSHIWFNPDLARPDTQGAWIIDDLSPNSVNGYIFEIPQNWAVQYTGGFPLGTGRFKDGGWSGMGPALIAYRPWQADGSPALAGTRLSAKPLLLYTSSQETEYFEHSMNSYQHPDEWEGGAWLTTTTGKSAVIFAGTKSNGEKYWYGWVNPLGPEYACVEVELADQFTLCHLANGEVCPPEDMRGCSGHNDFRGWWSTHFDAQLIFYNPEDLARVAVGEFATWQPQPYAVLDIDDALFLNPAGVETGNLGTGDQRRYRIGEVGYDRANGLLYVLELFADEAQPVVHVWRIR